MIKPLRGFKSLPLRPHIDLIGRVRLLIMSNSSQPLALSSLEAIIENLGSNPAVFLDYDGTLAAIVDDPVEAHIDEEVRRALLLLSRSMPVGVISGRALDDVKSMVSLDGLIYGGSHGFEIETADGERLRPPDVGDSLAQLQQADHMLKERSAGLNGIFIEAKPYAIAVHTRRAESQEVRRAAGELAREVAARFDHLVIRGGKEIHELRPAMDWDKGAALIHLLETLPDVHVPLYIGDDETDEDAFRAAESRSGVGIIVAPAPTNSSASYRLRDHEEVREFLETLSAR